MANPYLDSLTRYGGSLGTAARHAGAFLNNPIVKGTTKVLPFVSAGFDAYNDYQEGIKSGETGLRAGVGSALAGTGDALFWTGARTLNPLMMAAGVGADALGWVADRGFEAFDKGDGFRPGTPAYQKAWAAEYQKDQANYNSNPSSENKQKMQQSYANATGSNVSTPSESISSELDNYYANATKFAEKYLDPDSPFNQRSRALSREDDAWQDERKLRDAAFTGRYNIGAANLASYWKRLENSAADAATLANAGTNMVAGGRF